MIDKDKIPQFWDKGIMLVTGCSKVSPGCKNCWSEKAHVIRCHNQAVEHIYSPSLLTDNRFNGKVQFNLHLLQKAAKRKKPTVYAIWNDLYHEGITISQASDAQDIMMDASQHTWLIVTKHPERAFLQKRLSAIGGGWPDNIWHIVTCENQAMADKRIPHLLRIPGKRGIIIEPMLGPMDITTKGMNDVYNFPTKEINGRPAGWIDPGDKFIGLDQVILGPENGSGKRPFDPAWADSVKAQCEAAGVPFYRKDTGQGALAWEIK